MFDGTEIAGLFQEMGVTHVVTVPDSTIGQWDEAMQAHYGRRFVRVCREGEAWGIAGGLFLGGASPLVLIQCTGLFESGDALRNVIHDWKLPIFSVIGYRSYLDQSTLPGDTCLVFTEPVLNAWSLDWKLIASPDDRHVILEHYLECRRNERPGVALLAEGKA